MKNLLRLKLTGGALVLASALLANSAPALAQDYGYTSSYNMPAGQLDSLVSRIALYPDPLLAQIFAAAAFPDQIAAAAQGSGGNFDPSVEALMQYPSVLQMMASDPSWTQALGQAVMQDQGGVMDTIQNLRREAQQYGYLQNGPQMQVVDDGGYIDIEPVGGYLYVPVYDPYVVFASPRPGFFVGGAIRFGGGFHWAAGYDRFNWRNHELVVNRQVWTPPVRRNYQPSRPAFNQGWFANSGRNFTPPAVRVPTQRNFTAPQRTFTPAPRPMEPRAYAAAPQMPQHFTAPTPVQQHNFTAPPQMPQRTFTAPQQRSFTPTPQRNFAPQVRNEGGHVEQGGHGRGR